MVEFYGQILRDMKNFTIVYNNISQTDFTTGNVGLEKALSILKTIEEFMEKERKFVVYLGQKGTEILRAINGLLTTIKSTREVDLVIC